MFAITLLIAAGTLGSILAKAERPQLDPVANVQIDTFDLMANAPKLPVQSAELY